MPPHTKFLEISRWIETSPVVGHFEKDFPPIPVKFGVYFSRPSMANGIVDRLLHHSEKGQGNLGRQLFLDACLYDDLHPKLPRKPLGQLVERLG